MAFKYVKGDSHKDHGDDLKTYGITELHGDDTVKHGNKIIKLLNGGEKR